MKKKKQVIISAVFMIILFSIFAIIIMWNGEGIESRQKSKNYKKLDKAVQSHVALESLLDEHMGGWSKYEGEGLDYVDEMTFQKLKKIYEGIEFKGEFKTGDKEAYDYYRKKYAKLLNGDVKIMDDEKREYSDGEGKSLEYYGYDTEYLEESNIYYFDMDEDGLPELCLSGYTTYVFKYITDTDEYRIWYANESMSSEISGSMRISDSYVGNHSLYYSFYELNRNGDVEISVDFGEEFYENEEYCYYVHLPEYEDKTREPKIQKELKKQKDDSKFKDYYTFRVTKKQYDELTKAYFDTQANVWKETVHMSYFYPEKERLYDSIFELPDNMTYADEQAFQRLKDIYENIDFYGEFNKGDPEAYEEYRKKYAKLLCGRAKLVDDYALENNLEYSLEEYLGEELDKTSISLYYYDIDEDSLPELNIQGIFGSYIFKYNPKTHKHYLWSKKGEGVRLTGRRKYSYEDITSYGSFYDYYEEEEDSGWDFKVEFGIREPKEETELIYMVSWPLYGDKTGKPRLTKEMKKQGYLIDYGNTKQYFYRITKSQYETLTKKYFKADALLLDVSVPFTFFLPEGQEDW